MPTRIHTPITDIPWPVHTTKPVLTLYKSVGILSTRAFYKFVNKHEDSRVYFASWAAVSNTPLSTPQHRSTISPIPSSRGSMRVSPSIRGAPFSGSSFCRLALNLQQQDRQVMQDACLEHLSVRFDVRRPNQALEISGRILPKGIF